MKIFGAPNRYVQGSGILDQIGEILSPIGDRFFIFGDEVVLSITRDKVVSALERSNKIPITEIFQGECSYPEISRLKTKAEENQAQAIVGIGGGKVLDTTKVVSAQLDLPLVIVPTIASTDAPVSHLAVVYNENHSVQEILRIEARTSFVLADTKIIAQAPVRFLLAGIGDALSTKFETEACWKSGATNLFGGRPCQAALHLAGLAYEIIREYAEEAKSSVESRQVTPPLENVVEAIFLLSGLGFENGGLAAAHAVHGGLSLIQEMNQSLHGETVAFGILVQLVLENREEDFIYDMIGFYKRLGLPTNLKDLGLKEFDMAKIEKVASRICQEGSYIFNMAFEVDKRTVVESILRADSLGRG